MMMVWTVHDGCDAAKVSPRARTRGRSEGGMSAGGFNGRVSRGPMPRHCGLGERRGRVWGGRQNPSKAVAQWQKRNQSIYVERGRLKPS